MKTQSAPSFVPNPSILEKLEQKLPHAADLVMARAEEIRKTRHSEEKENSSNKSKSLKERFIDIAQSFTDGMAMASSMQVGYVSPVFSQTFQNNTQTVIEQNFSNDCTQIGNDMRAAIKEIMAENNLTADDLNLSDTEIADLEPRPLTQSRQQSGFNFTR